MSEIPKAYNPKKVEDKIYKAWEKSGFFNPDNLPEENIKKDKDGKDLTYTIVLPPPNITSKLHLGHAAMLAIEDLMIRYHRMKGYRTLWIPGTDHAAIATQNVVEKKLLKEEKLTRHDLGREKFLKKVWEYLKETQVVILNQTRKMGASLDWSREAFTLDKQREKAVRKMFVDMYEAGVIYRGERIVNWCPRCHSTLADDEVEYKEQKAMLYTFRYSKDFPFTIATTRPETKLGDTAVAVNPKDKRYKKYIGRVYEVDFCGVKLKLKIIADRHVEMDFGTGALGVTPAHSMADWQMAEENDLEIIKVIGEDGKIKNGFGDYSGKSVEEAREMIVEKLRKGNLLEKEEEIENNLSLCYRCGTAIEPLPSKQWFIKVDEPLERFDGKSLKEKAIEVAKDKSIKFIPERFEKRYLDWMENLHDWCISRQIWFGHRIPVWYKNESRIKNQELRIKNLEDEQKVYVGIESPEEKTNFVFLRGFLRTPDVEDPLNWLNEKLKNKDNFTAKLPNPNNPNLSEQINFAYKNAKINKNTIIVAHSIGCILAMKLIEEHNLKIKKLVLIAPPMQTAKTADGKIRKELKDYSNGKFDFKKIKKLIDGAVVFCDVNDHIILPEEPKIIAKKLNAKIIELKAPASHFNCEKCNEILDEIQDTIWTQDPDSLDTWFSSGMWTFSTLGWPDNFKDGEKINDLAKFHPTQVLETGYEILTLWVSRMIIMSLFALKEIPFENVYLHGMVLDKHGKKMSKSKGNGIDPIEVIDKFGTDAVRLSLLIGSTPGNDVRFSEEKIEGQRNFVNKLWNISRYILQNQESGIMDSPLRRSLSAEDCDEQTRIPLQSSAERLQRGGDGCREQACLFSTADKWILGELNNLIKEVTDDLENYNFSAAGENLRNFTWNDFADWYLEVSKIEKGKDEILVYILKQLLILWHPFIPFVTEEIWKNLEQNPPSPLLQRGERLSAPPSPLSQKGKSDLLMIEKWSSRERKFSFPTAGFETIRSIVTAVRNARAEYKIEPKKKIEAIIYAGADYEIIKNEGVLIKNLRTGIDELEIKEKGDKIKDAVYLVVGNIEIYLVGIIDKEKEKKNLEKEIDNLKKYLSQIENKLNNKKFVANAPREIVEKEKNKYNKSKEKLEKLKEKLKSLS